MTIPETAFDPRLEDYRRIVGRVTAVENGLLGVSRDALQTFTAQDCANYFTAARYEPGRMDSALMTATATLPVSRGGPLRGYGPHKTLYNRFIRWSRLSVFARIFAALAAEAGVPEQLMIDSTHLKAHRTAASLLQKRGLVGRVASEAA